MGLLNESDAQDITRKGNGVTLRMMNCRITDASLRGVCRSLLGAGRSITHRELRQVLRDRFGAIGKTARVLRVWREESERLMARRLQELQPKFPTLPIEIQALQERLAQSETETQAFKTRAEMAELREQSHQDRWALEIDRLREQLRSAPNYEKEIRRLQTRISELTVELAAVRTASQ
jgi:hypothetical protein